MITVEEAEKIILAQQKDFGDEAIPLQQSLGRVLAQDIVADRDIPPFNRATMDGIAIRYEAIEKGIESFYIKAIQAAGEPPLDIEKAEECVEIMTGAALADTADTVLRYEDLEIKNNTATILTKEIKKGQNIHEKGKDKKQNEVIVKARQLITSPIIGLAASVGMVTVIVKKLPKVVVLSTGNELVDINETPLSYQIRKSNNYTIQAVLQQHCLNADLLHLPDDMKIIRQQLQKCVAGYDVIILSGGVSMGKFDFVHKALEELSFQKLFYRVQQKPGKPFWFGKHDNDVLVFAFPGNPVSVFMCLIRYFIPWLKASLGSEQHSAYAVLKKDISFTPALQYFMQVSLCVTNSGHLTAEPVDGNGSGDFVNLTEANAFMELPAAKNYFKKGEVYPVWPFSFYSSTAI